MKRIFTLFLILFSTGAFAEGPGLHDPIDISSKFLYDHSKILKIPIKHRGSRYDVNSYQDLSNDVLNPYRDNLKNVYTISIQELRDKCIDAYLKNEEDLIKYNTFVKEEMPSMETYTKHCNAYAITVCEAAHEENKRVAAEKAERDAYVQNNPASPELFAISGISQNHMSAIQSHRQNVQEYLANKYCHSGTYPSQVSCTANGTQLTCVDKSRITPNYNGDVFFFCKSGPRFSQNSNNEFVVSYSQYSY